MNFNLKNLALYAGSAALVVLAFYAFDLGEAIAVKHYVASFWALFGLDFYFSQVRDNGRGEVLSYSRPGTVGASLVDRFFGYLFFAPLIAPARVYQLVRR